MSYRYYPAYYTSNETAEFDAVIDHVKAISGIEDVESNEFTDAFYEYSSSENGVLYRDFVEGWYVRENGDFPTEDELNELIMECAFSWLIKSGVVKFDVNGMKKKKMVALSKNYHPLPLVETAEMPNDAWLKWRTTGIGGSDAATLFGVSHWKTNVDIYNSKIGKAPEIPESDNNWFVLEYGHVNEELVAKCFSRSTGMPIINDTVMYRHPIFPWMQANLDRKTVLQDGRQAIVEIKTTTRFNSDAWDNDTVPMVYDFQGRHYMSIMNIDTIFYACLYGNVESDCVRRRRERDLSIEEGIIDAEAEFWLDHVLPKVEPAMIGDPSLKLKTIRKFSGFGDPSLEEVGFTGNIKAVLSNIETLQAKKDAAKKAFEEASKELEEAMLPIAEAMGQYCTAFFEEGNEYIKISYNPSFRDVVDKEKLKLVYPEAYADCISKGDEIRTMRIGKRKKKSSKFKSPTVLLNV